LYRNQHLEANCHHYLGLIVMATFQITIDDTLAPGIIATAILEGKQPEKVVEEYATSMATKVCQDLKVGPYYTGPVPPQFNADGTPYVVDSDFN
jgi:hypothetical protein